MIVWLASYPRSGNTMLRTMMQRAFGLRSFSMYDDTTDVGSTPEIREQTGHAFLDSSFDEFYRNRKSSPELNLVKTHQPPIDDGRAIYIVRDGRSAVISWYNMLVRLRKRDDVTVQDIIRGEKVQWGHWSGHVKAWDPMHRPATLLLRYTDLVENADEALDRIAAFINMPRVGVWKNNFDELHRLFPEFFHRGSDEKNLAQMSPVDEAIFWRLHGECMRDMGFALDVYARWAALTRARPVEGPR
jgi:hypothetical protein